MEIGNSKQKEYFRFAYTTGSDIWTHVPYHDKALSIINQIAKKDDLILDIGCGRGLLLMKLLKDNFKVIGIDYIETIVNSVNRKIHEHGYSNQGRAKVSSSTNIDFDDLSFDLACSFGHYQHIDISEQSIYSEEVSRVLKKDSYYLQASLSKNTENFLGHSPKGRKEVSFIKFGVQYNFVNQDDIIRIFSTEFNILQQNEIRFKSKSDPKDDIVFLFSLMQKK